VVHEIEDLEAVSQLQERIWGSIEAAAPASVLKAMASAGGITLLAETDSEPVGFAYGFTGRTPGGLVYHRSHAAGVVAEMRGTGVGREIKTAQRKEAIRQGLTRMVWTFDPNQSRNAHFNLHRLGATARTFHLDYYGERIDALNLTGISDRLVVEWFFGETENEELERLRERPDRVTMVSAGQLPDPADRGTQLRLRAELERAFGAGLSAIDYDGSTGTFWFAELPASFPPPAEGGSGGACLAPSSSSRSTSSSPP
jgi:predicted GNAT superfamily acetyltransferase